MEMRPDNNVPIPTRPAREIRFRNKEIEAMVKDFAKFKPGQSFFIPNGGKAELDLIRRPFREAGLGYLTRKFTCDPIFKCEGVRVWRQHGSYDDEL